MRIALLLVTASLCASAAGWKHLFNGRDLTGWKMVGPGEFAVENGQLKTSGGMGLLYYAGEKLGNCTLRVVFRTLKPKDNSGVFIRLPEQPRDPWYAVHNGYEVQIDGVEDDWHYTGSLYSLSKVTARTQKGPGKWNRLDIVLRGQRTIIYLNGKKVNEFDGNQPVPPRQRWYEPVRGPRPDSGYAGLQNHNPRDTVYFRQVSVRYDQ
jgi:hypothetical protein